MILIFRIERYININLTLLILCEKNVADFISLSRAIRMNPSKHNQPTTDPVLIKSCCGSSSWVPFRQIFGCYCEGVTGSMRSVAASLCFSFSLRFARPFSVVRSGFFGRLPSEDQSPSNSKRFQMTAVTDDPYIWLEEVESEESLQFARDANEACLKALGDPTKSGTGTYDKVLSVLESSDRIPYVAKYGKDDDGNDILMNFWKDSSNPKGLWRKTTMASYLTNDPQWEIVLDVDELAKKDEISWVWSVSFTNSSGFIFPVFAALVSSLLFLISCRLTFIFCFSPSLSCTREQKPCPALVTLCQTMGRELPELCSVFLVVDLMLFTSGSLTS
jgi:hypothetical protein